MKLKKLMQTIFQIFLKINLNLNLKQKFKYIITWLKVFE